MPSVLADLSVEHSGTLGRYRAAEEISQSAAAGTASTQDLRLVMIHYRALFGGPADAGPGPAATGPGQVIAADDMAVQDGDAHVAAARNAVAADGPAAARQHFNGSDAQDLTK
jgi:hypothetical protein